MEDLLFELFITSKNQNFQKKNCSEHLKLFNLQKSKFVNSLSTEQVIELNELEQLLRKHYEEIYFDWCKKGIYFGVSLNMVMQEIERRLTETLD